MPPGYPGDPRGTEPSIIASPPMVRDREAIQSVEAGEVFCVDAPAIIEHLEGRTVTLLPPYDVFKAARGGVRVWSPNNVAYADDTMMADSDRDPRVIKWPAEASAVDLVGQRGAATKGPFCGAYTVELDVSVEAEGQSIYLISVPWRRHTAKIEGKTTSQLDLTVQLGLNHERFAIELRRKSANSELTIVGSLEFWDKHDEAIETFRGLGTLAQWSAPARFTPVMGDRVRITVDNASQQDTEEETILITFYRCFDAIEHPDCNPQLGNDVDVDVDQNLTTLLAYNQNRVQVTFQNLGPNTAYISPSANATLTDSHALAINESFSAGKYGGAGLDWTAICAAGETADIRIMRIFCNAGGTVT
jgi:hypothetical protein